MNQSQNPQDTLWPEVLPDQELPDETFETEILNRVQNRVVFRDLLTVMFRGFGRILAALLGATLPVDDPLPPAKNEGDADANLE